MKKVFYYESMYDSDKVYMDLIDSKTMENINFQKFIGYIPQELGIEKYNIEILLGLKNTNLNNEITENPNNISFRTLFTGDNEYAEAVKKTYSQLLTNTSQGISDVENRLDELLKVIKIDKIDYTDDINKLGASKMSFHIAKEKAVIDSAKYELSNLIKYSKRYFSSLEEVEDERYKLLKLGRVGMIFLVIGMLAYLPAIPDIVKSFSFSITGLIKAIKAFLINSDKTIRKTFIFGTLCILFGGWLLYSALNTKIPFDNNNVVMAHTGIYD